MMSLPVAPFSHLSTLWIQITGTWCNLQCTHCINSSGPKHPWLKSLDTATVKRYLKEAEALGVEEIYFTGGEPFLHRDILELLGFSLRLAPTTVLTNGTMINTQMADALASLAEEPPYSQKSASAWMTSMRKRTTGYAARGPSRKRSEPYSFSMRGAFCQSSPRPRSSAMNSPRGVGCMSVSAISCCRWGSKSRG